LVIRTQCMAAPAFTLLVVVSAERRSRANDSGPDPQLLPRDDPAAADPVPGADLVHRHAVASGDLPQRITTPDAVHGPARRARCARHAGRGDAGGRRCTTIRDPHDLTDPEPAWVDPAVRLL